MYSTARNAYYNNNAYPTIQFDGILEWLGGTPCPEPYGDIDSYLPLINQRMATPSPFLMEMELIPMGNNECELSVHIQKVGTINTDNLRLRVAITESHIHELWQCLTEVSFVNRLMVPNAMGTLLDFSVGDEITVDLFFVMSNLWNKENLELVAFIQNDNGQEVLQTIKSPIPLFTRDAQISDLYNIPGGNCSGVVQPSFKITNKGAEPLTSLTINCQVNNEAVVTTQWTGDLSFLQEEHVLLDPVPFAGAESNTVLVYGSGPNGNLDQNPDNDTLSAVFGDAFQADYYKIALTLQTDGAPQQTTYEVRNLLDEILYTGGPFEAPNQLVKDTFELEGSGCYRFIIYDQGCNGLNGGYYWLKEAIAGGGMIASGDEFGCIETTEFEVNWVGTGEPGIAMDPLRIFPNPFSMQTELFLNLDREEAVLVEVYNMTGMLIHSEELGVLPAGGHQLPLTAGHVSPGLNFVRVKMGEKIYTQKLVLQP